MGMGGIPEQMHLGGVLVRDGLVPNSFAGFFRDKVRSLSKQAVVSGNVFNGKRKVNCNDKMFIPMDDITECVRSIKINGSLGFYIPCVSYKVDVYLTINNNLFVNVSI